MTKAHGLSAAAMPVARKARLAPKWSAMKPTMKSDVR
jgi:hypothetical protein